MDEYKISKGKALAYEYKEKVKDLMCHTNEVFGASLVENVHSSLLPTLFEIVNERAK